MNVNVISERILIEKQLDINYPFYLYFQDEYCMNDELHKVDENFTIIVKCGIIENSIQKKQTYIQDEYFVLNNMTTKEHFIEIYNIVNDEFKKLKDN